eukprot:5066398-Prymnesium_polylepis.1
MPALGPSPSPVFCYLFSVLGGHWWTPPTCFGAVPVPRSPFSVRCSGRARAGFGAVPVPRSPFPVPRS